MGSGGSEGGKPRPLGRAEQPVVVGQKQAEIATKRHGGGKVDSIESAKLGRLGFGRRAKYYV